MSSMKYARDQRGSSTAMVVSLVATVLLLVGAIVFGVWAFMGRQDYKNNVDSKIATAVQANTKTVQAADAKTYAEEAKNPLKTYVGPEAYGSVHISYPKTWSAYVSTSNSGQPFDFYAHPDVVPGTADQNITYALRAQVVNTSYSNTLSRYSALQKAGQSTVAPYALPKNSSVLGVRVDGMLANNVKGHMVILPLRDKTLQIWTESDQYVSDFNNIILANASFSP